LKYGLFGKNLAFRPGQATLAVQQHLDHWFLLWIWYPIGIIASCFHLANGFWTAAITWGLTVSAGAQRRWGYVCGAIFALTLICGFLAIIGGGRADPHLLVVPH
jgi:succinate dehydrogenase / fumarate reductase cytochrome b subunit